MASDKEIVTVWWIDDDHTGARGPRAAERAVLEEQAGEALNLIAIHPAAFEDRVSDLSDESAPDLLLIDFRLGTGKLPGKDTPFYARDGATLRGITLGNPRLKDVPAYLVSQVARKEQIGSSDDQFDWVLSHQKLHELGGMFLATDAKDYRELRNRLGAALGSDGRKKVQRGLVDATCDLLRVPDASLDSVEEVVDHTVGTLLRNELTLDSDKMRLAPSRTRAIARWIRSALQKFRGPLIDELCAATMMGSNLEHFQRAIRPSMNLDSLEYTGIFRGTASMTLWRQDFLQLLVSQGESIQLSPRASLAQSAAEHFCVPEERRSVCRVCRKPLPEAIAFDEDDPRVEDTVHWRCSNEAAGVDSPIGFDIPRSFGQ